MLRSHRTSSRRSDAKAKKQKKKKVRRQTGRAQAGAVAQGGRQLDKYAWLQVTTSCIIHFPHLHASFVLGSEQCTCSTFVSYCANESRLALSRKGLVPAASYLCLMFHCQATQCPGFTTCPNSQSNACLNIWHGFIMQQDGCHP